MTRFQPGQRVVKTVCAESCDSIDCGGIPVGSTGVVVQDMSGTRTSIEWDHRPPDSRWWVWNHGLRLLYIGRLYTELIGGDRDGGA
jgi:hypothetical protein